MAMGQGRRDTGHMTTWLFSLKTALIVFKHSIPISIVYGCLTTAVVMTGEEKWANRE